MEYEEDAVDEDEMWRNRAGKLRENEREPKIRE